MNEKKKGKKMKTPEESVAEPTWSLRVAEEDADIRQMIAQIMRITGVSRTEAIMGIVRAELPSVLRRVAEEKQREIAEIQARLKNAEKQNPRKQS